MVFIALRHGITGKTCSSQTTKVLNLRGQLQLFANLCGLYLNAYPPFAYHHPRLKSVAILLNRGCAYAPGFLLKRMLFKNNKSHNNIRTKSDFSDEVRVFTQINKKTIILVIPNILSHQGPVLVTQQVEVKTYNL